MNFGEYIESLTPPKQVNESQITLQDLVDNFRKVFPYSDKESHVINYHVDGKDTTDMKCKGLVASETDPSKHYEVMAEFHRDSEEVPFSIMNIGKVNCTCRAYRYNVSHPNRKNSVQSAPIPGFSSIPNRIRNPRRESTVCKHLYAFLIYLYNKGIIKNN